MLESWLAAVRILPAIVIERADDAVPLAQTLLDAGLGIMEVTFRTPAGEGAIRAVRAAGVPIRIGAGTLRTGDDCMRARDAGADFGVSPGVTDELLSVGAGSGWPWLPGVTTPSESMRAASAGLLVQKLFPASLPLVDAMAGPFPDVRLVPTGGIDGANAGDYLTRSNVLAVAGTWIAPRALIAAHDFAEIRRRAEAARRLAGAAGDCV